MSKALHTLLLPALGLLLLAAPALAQTATYTFGPDSKVWIDGTSNKSPTWTVNAEQVEGSVTMKAAATAADPGVEAVQLTVPTQQLKGKNLIMNKLMYKSLKAEEFGAITYNLTSVESVTPNGDDGFTMETRGTLTLAGETREIAMTVAGTMQPDGTVVFTGSHTMLMSDFNIDPPVAMFGALRTGDEVVVHAELQAGSSAGAAGSN